MQYGASPANAGETLSCALELKNDTAEPLHFGFSQTSCGACLSVKSMPKEILPNETGIFELEFNTTGKRGLTPQNAAFWDGEPKTILVVADMTAVVRALWTDPETVSLGNLATNEPLQTKLYVNVRSPKLASSSKPMPQNHFQIPLDRN
ncbi:MAG: DUF1573 domain-containing protein [Thermoguttaceae bacterium]